MFLYTDYLGLYILFKVREGLRRQKRQRCYRYCHSYRVAYAGTGSLVKAKILINEETDQYVLDPGMFLTLFFSFYIVWHDMVCGRLQIKEDSCKSEPAHQSRDEGRINWRHRKVGPNDMSHHSGPLCFFRIQQWDELEDHWTSNKSWVCFYLTCKSTNIYDNIDVRPPPHYLDVSPFTTTCQRCHVTLRCTPPPPFDDGGDMVITSTPRR